MASKLNLTFVDHDGETSTAGFHGPNLDVNNIVAQAALMDAMVAATAGISVGNLKKDSRTLSETKFNVANAASNWAQRETKWLVRAVDSQGFPASVEIPAADLDLRSVGTQYLDVTTAEGIAFIAAFNAYAKSQRGDDLTFVEAVAVGRTI